jgi:hypothetical protein
MLNREILMLSRQRQVCCDFECALLAYFFFTQVALIVVLLASLNSVGFLNWVLFVPIAFTAFAWASYIILNWMYFTQVPVYVLWAMLRLALVSMFARWTGSIEAAEIIIASIETASGVDVEYLALRPNGTKLEQTDINGVKALAQLTPSQQIARNMYTTMIQTDYRLCM